MFLSKSQFPFILCYNAYIAMVNQEQYLTHLNEAVVSLVDSRTDLLGNDIEAVDGSIIRILVDGELTSVTIDFPRSLRQHPSFNETSLIKSQRELFQTLPATPHLKDQVMLWIRPDSFQININGKPLNDPVDLLAVGKELSEYLEDVELLPEDTQLAVTSQEQLDVVLKQVTTRKLLIEIAGRLGLSLLSPKPFSRERFVANSSGARTIIRRLNAIKRVGIFDALKAISDVKGKPLYVTAISDGVGDVCDIGPKVEWVEDENDALAKLIELSPNYQIPMLFDLDDYCLRFEVQVGDNNGLNFTLKRYLTGYALSLSSGNGQYLGQIGFYPLPIPIDRIPLKKFLAMIPKELYNEVFRPR